MRCRRHWAKAIAGRTRDWRWQALPKYDGGPEMEGGPRPRKRRAMHRSILRADELRERLRASAKGADRRSSEIPLRHHFKVHLFRALTVILAWFLIVAAFY